MFTQFVWWMQTRHLLSMPHPQTFTATLQSAWTLLPSTPTITIDNMSLSFDSLNEVLLLLSRKLSPCVSLILVFLLLYLLLLARVRSFSPSVIQSNYPSLSRSDVKLTMVCLLTSALTSQIRTWTRSSKLSSLLFYWFSVICLVMDHRWWKMLMQDDWWSG